MGDREGRGRVRGREGEVGEMSRGGGNVSKWEGHVGKRGGEGGES